MYICSYLAGPKFMTELGSGEMIGVQPVDKGMICLNYYREKEPTQWVIWGIQHPSLFIFRPFFLNCFFLLFYSLFFLVIPFQPLCKEKTLHFKCPVVGDLAGT